MTRELNVIGKRHRLCTATATVSGKQVYYCDIHDRTDCLIAKVLTSPYAHAKIKSIDTSAAEALDGVRAVVTYKDIPTLMPNRYRCASDNFEGYGLEEEVKFVGDHVAFVAATTEEIALEALKLIVVEYEELPFVLNEEEATKDGAPVVRTYGATNNWRDYSKVPPKRFMPFQHIESWGNIKARLQDANVIVEGKFTRPSRFIGGLEHLGAMASWQGNKLTLRMTHQCPSEIKERFAHALGLKMNQVRVITPQVLGGTFGHCNHASRLEVGVALLSRKIGGAMVKYIMTTEEMFWHKHRDSNTMYWKMGVMSDGTLLAAQETHYMNNGSWGFKGHPHGHWYNTYNQIAAGEFTYFPANTNTVLQGCVRGVGCQATNFAGEQMIDMAAEAVGADPLEFRKKNCVRRKPFAMGPYGIDPNGIWTEDFDNLLAHGAEMIGWEEKWKGFGKPYYIEGAKRRGVGCGMAAYVSGAPGNKNSAIVEIEPDGTARVVEGNMDVGSNSRTTMAMVAAEALGFKFEDVCTNQEIDTDSGTWGQLTSSSITACHMGAAVTIAARDAKQKLLNVAAGVMAISAENLDVADSIVYDKTKPFAKTTKMAVKDILEAQLLTIIGTADWHHNDFPPMHYQTLASFADVEVDTDTGEVKILDLVHCHDVGQPLNPAVVENQIEGSKQMQIGHLFMEQSVYDSVTGRLLNPSYLELKNPTILDIPHKPGRNWLSDNIEDDKYFGIKGCGEGPVHTMTPAMANAIYNAIGIRIFDECYTPDKVLKALGKLEA